MMTLLLIIIFLFIIFTTFIFSLQLRSSKRKQHGFKLYPIMGIIPEFILNRHRFLDWTAEVLGRHPSHTITFTHPGRGHGVLIGLPENIEHVLKTNFHNYPKGSAVTSHLLDFLGAGILNSDGQLWKRQRKTAASFFTNRNLAGIFLDVVRSEISGRLVPFLKDASLSNRVVDLQDVLERFAFDNVCKVAFNVDPGCLEEDGAGESEFMRAFEQASNISSERFMYAMPFLWKVKKFFNVGSERKLRESIKTVHDYANNIIRMRIEDKSAKDFDQDILSRFISSNSETADLDLLRDVVMSFILAGRDTTSSGLSWFFWLLSFHPDVVSKIRSEVAKIRERAYKQVGETYNFDELREMNYLHAAISESLRLYPAVPLDTRVCLEDDVLPDGTEVKKDWFVTYHTYAMGRMASIWGKDCLEFRPERWLDENGLYKPDSPYRYPVFHAGPRVCLGKDMAYLQMKSIVACVVEQFDVDVLEKQTRPQYVLSLTLRIKGGLHVKVKAINTVQ